jgi:hypothetical protein
MSNMRGGNRMLDSSVRDVIDTCFVGIGEIWAKIVTTDSKML